MNTRIENIDGITPTINNARADQHTYFTTKLFPQLSDDMKTATRGEFDVSEPIFSEDQALFVILHLSSRPCQVSDSILGEITKSYNGRLVSDFNGTENTMCKRILSIPIGTPPTVSWKKPMFWIFAILILVATINTCLGNNVVYITARIMGIIHPADQYVTNTDVLRPHDRTDDL